MLRSGNPLTSIGAYACLVSTLAAGLAWGGDADSAPPLPLVDAGAPGAPPADAIVLLGPGFDAAALAAKWTNRKDDSRKAPPSWKLEHGVVTVAPGTGDMVTKQSFADLQMHIEWMLPPRGANWAPGEDAGNSGIKFHETYEIQIIDSYGVTANGAGQTGAVYKQHAPLVNVCRKPGEWQSFDIVFHPPRFENGKLVADGRFTVFHNGVLVQENAKILGRTNDARPMPQEYALPFFLQDHNGSVSFRNIWVRPLPPLAR